VRSLLYFVPLKITRLQTKYQLCRNVLDNQLPILAVLSEYAGKKEAITRSHLIIQQQGTPQVHTKTFFDNKMSNELGYSVCLHQYPYPQDTQ